MGNQYTCVAQVTLTGHRRAVTALRYSRNGSQLASGSQDTDAILWDVIAETGLFRLRAHTAEVTDVVGLAKNLCLQDATKPMLCMDVPSSDPLPMQDVRHLPCSHASQDAILALIHMTGPRVYPSSASVRVYDVCVSPLVWLYRRRSLSAAMLWSHAARTDMCEHGTWAHSTASRLPLASKAR